MRAARLSRVLGHPASPPVSDYREIHRTRPVCHYPAIRPPAFRTMRSRAIHEVVLAYEVATNSRGWGEPMRLVRRTEAAKRQRAVTAINTRWGNDEYLEDNVPTKLSEPTERTRAAVA